MSACAVRVMLAAGALAAAAVSVRADLVADNGAGSANLPPVGLTYFSVPSVGNPSGDMAIIDGLPVGTTIQVDASLHTCTYNMGSPPAVMSFPPNATGRQPGGSLGGEQAASDAILQMPMIGTGALAGFNRNIPVAIGHEIHLAPRTPFTSPQAFNTNLFRFFGQITNPASNDPDFDLLRIVAGTDFGLPSPGFSQLTQAGPAWDLYSYYDMTYRIDFVGRPGGALSGRSGSTTGVVRLFIVPAPGAAGLLACAGVVAGRRRRR